MSNPRNMAKSGQRDGTKPAGRDKTVSKAVGDKLRQLYDETLNEPVPKELSDLVERLSKQSDKPQN